MATSWERLADITLEEAGDKLDSGTITAKKYLRVEIHTFPTGGTIKEDITFNNSTGDEYARRRSNDGATDSENDEKAMLEVYGDSAQDRYLVMDIINIIDQEKLVIGFYNVSTVGAGTAPNRSEWVGKWANTSAQITQIECDNGEGSGDYAIGSQMTIWGADDVDDVPPNLPNGSVFITSDTNIHYMFNSSAGTWNEVA